MLPYRIFQNFRRKC